MGARKVEIETYASGAGSIVVDGRKLTGVTGFTLSHSVRGFPRLEVDVIMHEDTALCEECHVTIPDATRETLIALGCTPPDGA
jgi:hypothetical protein